MLQAFSRVKARVPILGGKQHCRSTIPNPVLTDLDVSCYRQFRSVGCVVLWLRLYIGIFPEKGRPLERHYLWCGHWWYPCRSCGFEGSWSQCLGRWCDSGRDRRSQRAVDARVDAANGEGSPTTRRACGPTGASSGSLSSSHSAPATLAGRVDIIVALHSRTWLHHNNARIKSLGSPNVQLGRDGQNNFHTFGT